MLKVAELIGLTPDLMPNPNWSEILAVLETRLSSKATPRTVKYLSNQTAVMEEENRRLKAMI